MAHRRYDRAIDQEEAAMGDKNPKKAPKTKKTVAKPGSADKAGQPKKA